MLHHSSRAHIIPFCLKLSSQKFIRTIGISASSSPQILHLLGKPKLPRFVTSNPDLVSLSNFSTDNFTQNSDASTSAHLHLTDTELRQKVLESALSYVTECGWTKEAVEKACAECGLPPGLHTLATPQGGIDLVVYFYASRNQQLSEAMIEWRLASGAVPSPNGVMPAFDTTQELDGFLYRALKYRLEKNIPVLQVWPQAMGLLAYPQNVPSSIGLLAQLVDEVWAQAGDRSTDMTWYAKRLGLAYAYSLTELFMLQDSSPELIDSWNYLQTRIVDLRSLKQMNLKAVRNILGEGLCALGNVTFNVLGLRKR